MASRQKSTQKLEQLILQNENFVDIYSHGDGSHQDIFVEGGNCRAIKEMISLKNLIQRRYDQNRVTNLIRRKNHWLSAYTLEVTPTS